MRAAWANVPVAIHRFSNLAFALAFLLCRFFLNIRERPGVAKFVDISKLPGADAVKQIGLPRFQGDQPAR
jgi:hypothetical protein